MQLLKFKPVVRCFICGATLIKRINPDNEEDFIWECLDPDCPGKD